jgi:hypothetical protein
MKPDNNKIMIDYFKIFDKGEQVGSVRICTIFCPFCASPNRFFVPENTDYPKGLTNPCPGCNRDFDILFDYNGLRLDIPYASSSNT